MASGGGLSSGRRTRLTAYQGRVKLRALAWRRCRMRAVSAIALIVAGLWTSGADAQVKFSYVDVRGFHIYMSGV